MWILVILWEIIKLIRRFELRIKFIHISFHAYYIWIEIQSMNFITHVLRMLEYLWKIFDKKKIKESFLHDTVQSKKKKAIVLNSS